MSPESLLSACAAHFKTTPALLRSTARHHPLVYYRELTMRALREYGLTPPEIGELLKRDRTTVTAGCAHIDKLLADGDTRASRDVTALMAIAASCSVSNETVIGGVVAQVSSSMQIRQFLQVMHEEVTKIAMQTSQLANLLGNMIARIDAPVDAPPPQKPLTVNVEREGS